MPAAPRTTAWSRLAAQERRDQAAPAADAVRGTSARGSSGPRSTPCWPTCHGAEGKGTGAVGAPTIATGTLRRRARQATGQRVDAVSAAGRSTRKARRDVWPGHRSEADSSAVPPRRGSLVQGGPTSGAASCAPAQRHVDARRKFDRRDRPFGDLTSARIARPRRRRCDYVFPPGAASFRLGGTTEEKSPKRKRRGHAQPASKASVGASVQAPSSNSARTER